MAPLLVVDHSDNSSSPVNADPAMAHPSARTAVEEPSITLVGVESQLAAIAGSSKEGGDGALKSGFNKRRRQLREFLGSRAYSTFSMGVIVLNAAVLGTYTRTPQTTGSLYSSWLGVLSAMDIAFSCYFILDFILMLVAKGFRVYQTWLGYFETLVVAVSVMNLIPGTSSLTGIRTLLLIRYVELIPRLEHTPVILSSLRAAAPLLRDVCLLAAYFLFAFGIIGVNIWSGQFHRRCVDSTNTAIVVLLDQTCSNDPMWGFQCPTGSVCVDNGFNNPYHGTVSFDNILYAILTIFQTITMEGWSVNMFLAMDATTPMAFLYFIVVLLVGLQVIVQPVIAIVSMTLREKAEEWDQKHLEGNIFTPDAAIDADETVNTSTAGILESLRAAHTERILRSDLLSRIQGHWYRVRYLIYHVVTHKFAERAALVVTFLSALVLALEYKILGLGLRNYLKSKWNVLDGTFTILGLVDIFYVSGEYGFTSLRVLRAFRIVRISKFSPQLSRLARVFVRCMPLVLPLLAIWLALMYTFSIVGMQLFSNEFDFDDGKPRFHFDSLPWALFSVVNLFTTENWNNIEVSVARSRGIIFTIFPLAVVVLGAYIVSQLLLGIIIASFQAELMAEREKRARKAGQTSSTEALFGDIVQVAESIQRPLKKYFRPPGSSLLAEELSETGTIASTQSLGVSSLPDSLREAIFTWKTSRMRLKLRDIVRSQLWERFFMLIVLASCVVLALDVPKLEPNSSLGRGILIADFCFAVLFVLELFAIGLADGLFFGSRAHLRDPINWIDVAVIAISVACLTPAGRSLRALRVLRLVRVIRLIKMHEELRVVTLAVMKTIPALYTAIIPYGLFLFMFSVLGLSIFLGEGWQCNDPSVTNRAACTGPWINPSSGNLELRRWSPYRLTYDGFFQSLLSVTVISMQEGWPDDANRYMDAAGRDNQPVRDNAPANILFWIVTVRVGILAQLRSLGTEILGNWLFLAVISGLVFDNLRQNAEKLRGIQFLSEEKKRVISSINLLLFHRLARAPARPTSLFKKRVQAFVLKSTLLSQVTLVVVLLDAFRMILAFYGEPNWLSRLRAILEIIFVSYYIFEILIKLYAVGLSSFLSDNWNIVNIAIVIFAVMDWIFQFWPGSATFIAVLRIFRSFRTLRVLRYLKTLKALITAIIVNIAQLFNVLMLQFLVVYCYAIIGMHAFGSIKESSTQNMGGHVSFSTFPNSLLLVFVLTTGENWPGIMTDCMLSPGDDPANPLCLYEDGSCGVQWAPIFFLSLQMINAWVLVNSFVGITMSSFSELLEDQNHVEEVESLIEEFTHIWSRYDPRGTGDVPFACILPIYRQVQSSQQNPWRRKLINAGHESVRIVFQGLEVKDNKVGFREVLSSVLLYCWDVKIPSNNRRLRRYLGVLESDRAPGVGSGRVPFDLVYSALNVQRLWRGKRTRRTLERAWPNPKVADVGESPQLSSHEEITTDKK
ncbi:hypothetical protein M427DRAFT_47550 [Gonapodya prolifera JEL478]|uniref:Ion transport domain-containing protein n=1 Tax=Gonapodya prolifera (strain JEL478) TaxID=1344416 RepID=A0A139A3E7_GONPJ|nr:hypothetical protein M427DRAFT_47550 [Gonapodya prolifera JEL478]|eukprot:KXS11005.1 hypothetical protein M427DRAFT_47550 [Gonapodya prolifera JEL478]